MTTLTKEQTKLLNPSNPVIKTATLDAFKKFEGMDMAAAEDFLNKAGGGTVPPPISAEATIVMGIIYGNLNIKPLSEHTNCKFNHDFWGIGAVGCESIGMMYTAYTSWDTFFKDVTSFHVQGIAEEVGFLQVNFFRHDALPIGQFNGIAGGVGAFEGGNAGKWTCS